MAWRVSKIPTEDLYLFFEQRFRTHDHDDVSYLLLPFNWSRPTGHMNREVASLLSGYGVHIVSFYFL
jgi:hypothetical protein